MLLITQATYSQSGIQGLIEKPEDRIVAIEKIVQAAGGKIVATYMTTGDYDILLIADYDDGEAAVALGMVAAASGSVSNIKTIRAWTTAEFVSVAERASALASSYSPPGT